MCFLTFTFVFLAMWIADESLGRVQAETQETAIEYFTPQEQ